VIYRIRSYLRLLTPVTVFNLKPFSCTFSSLIESNPKKFIIHFSIFETHSKCYVYCYDEGHVKFAGKLSIRIETQKHSKTNLQNLRNPKFFTYINSMFPYRSPPPALIVAATFIAITVHDGHQHSPLITAPTHTSSPQPNLI